MTPVCRRRVAVATRRRRLVPEGGPAGGSPHLSAMATEIVPCNLCGEPSASPRLRECYELGGMSIELGLVECPRCGLAYTSPRATASTLERVYDEGGRGTVSHAYCWAGKVSQARYAPTLERLASSVPSGRLLDVGCGAGAFLGAAAAHGSWELHGVEPSEQARGAALSHRRHPRERRKARRLSGRPTDPRADRRHPRRHSHGGRQASLMPPAD